MRILVLLSLLFANFLLSGCAAIHTQIEYADLKIFCYPGERIFLDTQPATAFVDVKAPPEITGVKEAIEQKLIAKNVRIVPTPDEADLVFQVVLSDASLQETSARRVQQFGGPTAASAVGLGAGVGYLGNTDLTGVAVGAVGGLVGGTLVDMTINNWVKLGELRVRADVLVREKLPEKLKIKGAKKKEAEGDDGRYARHQTNIVVRAQKANLTWDDCAVEVKARLVKEISGII
jgi:hypothetical protein